MPAASARQQHQCYWLRKKMIPLWDFFQPLHTVLLHISNTKSNKAAADECHCRCRNHSDGTASNTNQEPQAHTENNLGQLDHAGESSTVNALPSPVLTSLFPILQLQALQINTKQNPVKWDSTNNAQLSANALSWPPGAARQANSSLLPFCFFCLCYRGYRIQTEILQVIMSFPSSS